MIPESALNAIRAGRPGIHIAARGHVYEATGLYAVGNFLFIEVNHLNGDVAPMVAADKARVLERTYENEED